MIIQILLQGIDFELGLLMSVEKENTNTGGTIC